MALLLWEVPLGFVTEARDVGQRWLHLPGQGLSWRPSRWSWPIFGMVTAAFRSRGTSLSPSCPNNLTRGLRNPEAVKPHCCGHVLCGLLVWGRWSPTGPSRGAGQDPRFAVIPVSCLFFFKESGLVCVTPRWLLRWAGWLCGPVGGSRGRSGDAGRGGALFPAAPACVVPAGSPPRHYGLQSPFVCSLWPPLYFRLESFT